MKCFSQFDFRNVHANQASPAVCISIKTPCQMGAVGNHTSGLPWAWLVLWPQFGLCLHPPGSVLASCTARQPQPIPTYVPVLLEPAAARAAGARAEPGQLHLQPPTETCCAAGRTMTFSSHLQMAMQERSTLEGQAGCEREHSRLLCGNVTVSLADGCPTGCWTPPCRHGNG